MGGNVGYQDTRRRRRKRGGGGGYRDGGAVGASAASRREGYQEKSSGWLVVATWPVVGGSERARGGVEVPLYLESPEAKYIPTYLPSIYSLGSLYSARFLSVQQRAFASFFLGQAGDDSLPPFVGRLSEPGRRYTAASPP